MTLFALLRDDGSIKSVVNQEDTPVDDHIQVDGWQGDPYPSTEYERIRLVNGKVEWFDPRGPDEIAKDVRRLRDKLLQATDVDMLRLLEGDGTPQQAAAMKRYRKDLRDLTKQSGFPSNVSWPVRP